MLDRPPPSGLRQVLRIASPQLFALVLLGATACGDGGKSTVAKTDPAKTETKTTTDAKAEGGEAKADGGEAKAEGGEAKADSGEAKAEGGEAKAEGGEAKAEGGEAKAEGSEAKADEGKADDGAVDTTGGAAPADPAALLTEVKNKKTKDERAIAALEEALTAGAKLRDVAKAANARGEKLYETPDRAKTFFEWAAAKDPKYPDPEFNLAKQLVVTGDLDECKKHLEEVKKRGGKKLLGQIEYDATWEVVKDDPAVRKLIEG